MDSSSGKMILISAMVVLVEAMVTTEQEGVDPQEVCASARKIHPIGQT